MNASLTSEQIREQWLTDGYVRLPALLGSERAAALRDICDQVLDRCLECDDRTGKPLDPQGNSLSLVHHPAHFGTDHDQRRQFLELIANVDALDVAKAALDAEPLFAFTTYLYEPRSISRKGKWHRDTQGCLADPDDEIGERRLIEHCRSRNIQLHYVLEPFDGLQYVPGSHRRWDFPAEYYIRRSEDHAHGDQDGMPGAVSLSAAAGDVILLDSTGIHRGDYMAGKCRRTLLLSLSTTPYSSSRELYAQTLVNAYHQPWFLDPEYLQELSSAARGFYERFVQAYSPHWS